MALYFAGCYYIILLAINHCSDLAFSCSLLLRHVANDDSVLFIFFFAVIKVEEYQHFDRVNL